jgi:hypothetical protein
MTLELASLLVVSVLAADIWALTQIAGSREALRRKRLWAVIVLGLPAVGFAAWALTGPREEPYKH